MTEVVRSLDERFDGIGRERTSDGLSRPDGVHQDSVDERSSGGERGMFLPCHVEPTRAVSRAHVVR
jgi:hypothetical protein